LSAQMISVLFLCCSAPPRPLHSFPTRRSSDLPDRDARVCARDRDLGGGDERFETTKVELRSRTRAHRDRETATVVLRDGVSMQGDRKSTRLNSSHVKISYAVFCLKKKK